MTNPTPAQGRRVEALFSYRVLGWERDEVYFWSSETESEAGGRRGVHDGRPTGAHQCRLTTRSRR